MREADEKAVEALQDTEKLNCFMKDYEAYILKCASAACRRYVTKNDDEWSVAMEAFYNAVRTYSYDKGSFLRFSGMLIKRRLIDYFRKQRIHKSEFPVNPSVFSGEPEQEGTDYILSAEIAVKTTGLAENPLKDEIEAISQQLAIYGFSFYDLIRCSPKSKKTKRACISAVSCMLSSPCLCEEMKSTKNLPLKIIGKNAGVPRKILERHRKYIIVAVEILTGEYPGLSQYMRTLKEEE
ncbi:RNA polymerase sigma factor SigI7 [bioreactor metagenome]|uniref:RNA polymerase sigma factor SigI7 n=1 Tax=bioreactor metagenome TaxID=1076179 RepID=A0A645B241_9ZZZZ